MKETDYRSRVNSEPTQLGAVPCLVYSPLISLAGKCCVGFEAELAISDSADNGQSETINSSGPLLQQSATQLHFWQTHFLAAKGMRLVVKVTQAQWLSTTLVELCQQLSQQPATQLHGLVIEVEQATVLSNLQLSAEQVAALARVGIRVQVSHLVPSHSALARLEYCGITMVKLEPSFLNKLAECDKTQSFFSEVIQQFYQFNVEVTIPSIQTPEQVNLLTQLDCKHWCTWCDTHISASEATLMLYADSQITTDQLQDHLAAMNSLSKAVQTFLGPVLVAGYWEASRSDSPWLIADSGIWIHRGYLRTVKNYSLSPLQINELQQWTHRFIKKCQAIVKDVPKLLQSPDFTPAHAQLLGVQERYSGH